MVNSTGQVPVISTILLLQPIGITMVARMIHSKIRMMITMVSSMSMTLVHAVVIHHLVQHGFPIQPQTLMVMVVEILMKTLMMTTTDLKMQLMIVQPW